MIPPMRTESVALALSVTIQAQQPIQLLPTIVEAERIDDEPSAVSVVSGQTLDLFHVQ